MDSYREVRRVRKRMSETVGHEIRALIATINQRRADVLARIIDPGTQAEQCGVGAKTQIRQEPRTK